MEASNNQKMREVLEWCRDFMRDIYDGKEGVKFSAYDIERIDAALSEPVRNCDVGTAEEQYARFRDYCYSKRCANLITQNTLGSEVAFAWAQMPYEEGGAE